MVRFNRELIVLIDIKMTFFKRLADGFLSDQKWGGTPM